MRSNLSLAMMIGMEASQKHFGPRTVQSLQTQRRVMLSISHKLSQKPMIALNQKSVTNKMQAHTVNMSAKHYNLKISICRSQLESSHERLLLIDQQILGFVSLLLGIMITLSTVYHGIRTSCMVVHRTCKTSAYFPAKSSPEVIGFCIMGKFDLRNRVQEIPFHQIHSKAVWI